MLDIHTFCTQNYPTLSTCCQLYFICRLSTTITIKQVKENKFLTEICTFGRTLDNSYEVQQSVICNFIDLVIIFQVTFLSRLLDSRESFQISNSKMGSLIDIIKCIFNCNMFLSNNHLNGIC